MRTRIEPYCIKAVEPLPLTTRAERERALDAAGWNLFRLPARLVTIDLLTDSGVVAMSARQWGAMLQADESYAGADSFARFEAAVREVTGFAEVIPAHQGRAAERLLFEAMVRPGDVVPGNTHFDTTRANLERLGARPLDLPVPMALEPASEAPFKGNLQIEALEDLLHVRRPPLVHVRPADLDVPAQIIEELVDLALRSGRAPDLEWRVLAGDPSGDEQMTQIDRVIGVVMRDEHRGPVVRPHAGLHELHADPGAGVHQEALAAAERHERGGAATRGVRRRRAGTEQARPHGERYYQPVAEG